MMQSKPDTLDPVAGRQTLILGGQDFQSMTPRSSPASWSAWSRSAGGSCSVWPAGARWPGHRRALGVWEGIGVWGLNVPVGWAWDITNFVFWMGIGHAGTLISAILLLFRQKWRTSINRAAEAMTLFAVVCALTFPGFHVGRIWVVSDAPCPTRWSGRTSRARCCGTCSRSPPTAPSRCSSGISV